VHSWEKVGLGAIKVEDDSNGDHGPVSGNDGRFRVKEEGLSCEFIFSVPLDESYGNLLFAAGTDRWIGIASNCQTNWWHEDAGSQGSVGWTGLFQVAF
jgi:hypothetical protein